MKHLRLPFSLAALLLGVAPVEAQWSTDTLAVGRQELASAVHGQTAYFAGGRLGTLRFRRVDIYDGTSSTWSSGNYLSQNRNQLAGAAVGNYVLFAGGATSNTASSDRVDFFDTTSQTWGTYSLSVARFALSATTVGTKILFAGGASGGPMTPTPLAVVDIYDSALGAPDNPLAWSTSALPSVARGRMAATTLGSYALFAGGLGTTTALAEVDVYDDSTSSWSTWNLSQARLLGEYAATSVGTRAYFAGGLLGVAPFHSDVVDVYDSALGAPNNPLAWSTMSLSAPRGLVAATGVGSVALFAGGRDQNAPATVFDVVDVLETGSGTWGTSLLSQARLLMATATVGDRALFAGGGSSPSDGFTTVDVLDCAPASVGTYAGDGINADTIAPVAAALGQPWSAPLTIGHAHGVGGPLVLKMRTGTVNGPSFNSPVGGRSTEVLITGPLLYTAIGTHDGSSGDIAAVIVPVDLALLGRSWAAQYTVTGGGFADLSQAVAGTIGRP